MQKWNLSLNQHANLRTVHMRVRITVHKCRTQYSMERLQLLSLLTSNHHSSDAVYWRGGETQLIKKPPPLISKDSPPEENEESKLRGISWRRFIWKWRCAMNYITPESSALVRDVSPSCAWWDVTWHRRRPCMPATSCVAATCWSTSRCGRPSTDPTQPDQQSARSHRLDACPSRKQTHITISTAIFQAYLDDAVLTKKSVTWSKH